MVKRIIKYSLISLAIVIVVILLIIFVRYGFSPFEALQKSYLAKATEQIERGNRENAELYLKKAEILGKNTEYNKTFGKLYFRQKDYKAAIPYLLNSSTDTEAKEMLGLSYLRANQPKEALNVFKGLISINDSEKIREYYLSSIFAVGDLASAGNEVQNALSAYPNSVIFKKYRELLTNNESNKYNKAYNYLNSANWFSENGYFMTALSLTNSAIQTYPEYRDAYLMNSQIYINNKELSKALEAAQKAAQLDNHYYLTCVKLAEIHDKMGNAAEKEAALNRAKLLGYKAN